MSLGARRHRQEGQSVVEFALAVPLLLLLLTSLLDFGMAYNHNLTLEYATREGARVGGALVTGLRAGGAPANCGNAASGQWVDPDPYIVAAVQRVLESSGSPIDFSNVGNLVIYQVNNDGSLTGRQNIWTPALGGGPPFDINGDGTPDENLDFKKTSTGWDPCTQRSFAEPPGSIGVSLTYTYAFRFGLTGILRIVNPTSNMSQISMTDKTVMSFNPTQ